MKKLFKSKEFYLSLLYFVIGCLGIAIFLYDIITWEYRESFFRPENFNPYTVKDVASRFTHFTYFTNLTLLLFCFWAILNFIALVFNLKKLKSFLQNRYVLAFIAINQLIVMLIFSLTAFFPKQYLPKRWTTARIIKSTLALVKHYVLTTASIVYFFIKKPKNIEFKKCLLFLLYPIVYAIIVKIVGLTCFSFEWYPYPFFSTKHLWYFLFGSLKNFNYAYALLMVLAVFVVIFLLYLFFIWLLCLFCNRKPKSGGKTKEENSPKTEHSPQADESAKEELVNKE